MATPDSAGDSDPLNQLIAEYYERQERGEAVDHAAFLAAHTAQEDGLKSFFEGIDALRQVGVGGENGTQAAVKAVGRIPSPADDAPPAHSPSAVTSKRNSLDDTATVPPVEARASLPTSAASSPLPEQFGRYKIVKLLGQGGMGSVYLAHDTQLNRDVALKIPMLGGPEAGELVKRFYREAHTAATLRHPNICPVHDVGDIDGQIYLTMAFIEGRPLAKYISPEKSQNQRLVVTLVRKLALALAEAHRHGIVHRDLKPANVMIDARNEPVVMDFGLARQMTAHQEVKLTQSGMIVGTPAYMSPEQIDGDPARIGPQCDIWSMGVIFYELLTGRLPFEGNVLQIIGAIQHTDPPPPSTVRRGVDPQLGAICCKMLARSLDHRYQTMTEVAQALTECLKSLGKGDALVLSEPIQSTAATAPAAANASSAGPAPHVSRASWSMKTPAASAVRNKARRAKKTLSEEAITSIGVAARKLLARHDYVQVIQMLEDIPESRRTDEIQALLDKARKLADEVMFLLTEIDEAIRIRDGEMAFRKASDLLKIKPGHHRAREVQEEYGEYGAGGAVRVGRSSRFSNSVGKRTWVPLSLLAFGLCAFGAIVFLQAADGVVRIECDDDTIRLAIDQGELKVSGAYKEPFTLKPGSHGLKIRKGDDFEFETDKLLVRKGDKIVLRIEVVQGKLQVMQEGKGVLDLKELPGPPVVARIPGATPLKGAALKANGIPDPKESPESPAVAEVPNSPEPPEEPARGEPFQGAKLDLVWLKEMRDVELVCPDISRDGRYFLGSGVGPGLQLLTRVWDGKTGALLWSLASEFARFTRDGQQVVAFRSHYVGLHDAATGKLVRIICRPPAEKLFSGYISPDGETVACQQGVSLTLWEFKTGRLVHEFRPSPKAWDFSGEPGRIVVTPPNDSRPRICNTKTGKEVKTPREAALRKTLADFDSFRLDSAGRYAFAGVNGRPELWRVVDLERGTKQPWTPPEWGTGTGWSKWIRDHDSLVSFSSGLLRFYDVLTRKVHADYHFVDGDCATRVEISPDGNFAAVMTRLRNVVIFKLPPGGPAEKDDLK